MSGCPEPGDRKKMHLKDSFDIYKDQYHCKGRSAKDAKPITNNEPNCSSNTSLKTLIKRLMMMIREKKALLSWTMTIKMLLNQSLIIFEVINQGQIIICPKTNIMIAEIREKGN